MTENSQDLLQETVFRLLSCNQKRDEVFHELISVKGEKVNQNFLSCISEVGYLPLLQTSSLHLAGQQPSECVKKLIALAHEAQGKKLTTHQRDELDAVVSVLKTLKLHRGFHLTSILKTLSVECQAHPEVWMTLHKQGIVPLQHLIDINQTNSDFVASFARVILLFEKDSDNTRSTSEMMSGLIDIGFSIASSDKERLRDSANISVAILECMMKDILDQILKNEVKGKSVIKALDRLSVPLSVQKDFFSHLFVLIMGYRPEMKVSKAIREQDRWVYGKICPGLVMLYKQILLVINVEEIIRLISQLFEQHEVNWQLFLSFISVLTVMIEESQKSLLEFTDSLLQEGLEDCNMETTITGMLITRQTCLQGQHVFMSYADWFQRSFSESSRSFAPTRKSFTFLMKLLTDLAPFESADHLKVHILRPPHVPGKCRQILTDYIMLAKTRLQDLQAPLDVENQADETDRNKANDKFTEEINKAVEAYQNTGKIPTSIIEASIFRKPYYIGQFLPALLKPRPLPDMPDGKMKLIAALKKADKIPQTLFQNYEEECKKEAMKLLEGVFEVLDSDDDMELSPLEQLDNSLQQLMTWINTHHETTCVPKHSLREFVSVIASRVQECIGEKPVNNIDQFPMEINIQDINTRGHCLQVVDLILRRVCEAMQKMYAVGNFEFDWLTKLMEALLPYRGFTETLFKRMFILLVNQDCSLQNYHLDTLAAILVEIHMLKEQTTLPVFQCTCQAGSISVLETISQHMSMETGAQMSVALRFISSCLSYVYSSHSENRYTDATCVMKKFIYLSRRLVPGCRHTYYSPKVHEGSRDLNDLVILLCNSEFVKKLADRTEFGFHEWLGYELQVNINADFLNESERYEYHVWSIHHHYMKNPRGGYNTYMEAGFLMTKVLVNRENRQCSALAYLHSRGRNLYKGAEFGLLQQLSNLTQLFEETESQKEDTWLHEQLKASLNGLDGYDDKLSKQSLVLRFTRLIMNLPPYLLFSNVPRYLAKNCHSLQGSVDCINSVFVTYLSEGVVLPVNITVYLTQGLLQALQPCHQEPVVEFVFESCPSLLIACAVHFQAVAPFVDMLMGKGKSEVQRFFNDIRRGTNLTAENHWMSSSHVFSQIIISTQREILQEVLNKGRFKDDLTYKQVILKLTEMMFIQVTYLYHFEQTKKDGRLNRYYSALNIILCEEMKEDVLNCLLQGELDSKTVQCTNSHILHLYPISIIRFLRDHELVSVGECVSFQGFNRLLKSYLTLCQIYEDVSNIKTSKALQTEEISKTCRFLVAVIEKTPTKILKAVDQDILMECGPLIYDAVLYQI